MRNHLVLAIAWSATFAAIASAQPEADLRDYQVFFSPKADGSSPSGNKLTLRPNVANTAYFFCANQTNGEKSIYLGLFEDAEGSRPVAFSKLVKLPANQKRLVPLTWTRSATTPAATETKASDAASSQGTIALPYQLHVRISSEPFTAEKLGRRIGSPFTVTIDSPIRLLKSDLKTMGKLEGDRADFSIEIAMNPDALPSQYSQAPIKVKMNLRPDLNPHLGIVTYEEASLDAELPFAGDAVAKLSVNGLNIAKGDTVPTTMISLDIDGFARAAMYPMGNSNTPDRNFQSVFIRSDERLMVPGKPFKVTFEPYRIVEENGWSITRSRAVKTSPGSPDATPSVDLLKKGTALYDQTVRVSSKEDGSLSMTTTHADWSVTVPSAGMAGEFLFHAILKKSPNSDPRDDTRSAPAQVVIDPTRPDVSLNEIDGKKLFTGQEITLGAKATDSLSKVTKVWFYRGDPPTADGKPSAGSVSVPGRDSGDGQWTADRAIALPDQKGEVRLGVIAFNGVGLSNSVEKTLKVEPSPETKSESKKTTGTITGSVVKGYLGQSGLPVELLDSTGKTVVKTTTTAANGAFKFEDLPPGSYTVKSIKKADHNAQGSAIASVEAGKEAKVEVRISR